MLSQACCLGLARHTHEKLPSCLQGHLCTATGMRVDTRRIPLFSSVFSREHRVTPCLNRRHQKNHLSEAVTCLIAQAHTLVSPTSPPSHSQPAHPKNTHVNTHMHRSNGISDATCPSRCVPPRPDPAWAAAMRWERRHADRWRRRWIPGAGEGGATFDLFQV